MRLLMIEKQVEEDNNHPEHSLFVVPCVQVFSREAEVTYSCPWRKEL